MPAPMSQERHSEKTHSEEKHRKINLTPSQVFASALAASCAALVASTLGVAGTLIGAAVGSVVTTTGAAVYSHLFRTSGKKISSTINSVGASMPRLPLPVQIRPRGGADAYTADTVPADTVPADTVLAETVLARTAMAQSIPADRLYGAALDDDDAAAAPTVAQTPGLWTPRSSDPADPTAALEPLREAREPTLEAEQEPARVSGRGARFRKPIALAAAIAAVFGVSVVIGMLAGEPIRQATGSHGPSTPHSSAPRTPAGAGSASGNESGGASSSPSTASRSATPGSSGSPAPSGDASTPAGGAGSSPNPQSSTTAGGAADGGSSRTPDAAGSANPVG